MNFLTKADTSHAEASITNSLIDKTGRYDENYTRISSTTKTWFLLNGMIHAEILYSVDPLLTNCASGLPGTLRPSIARFAIQI